MIRPITLVCFLLACGAGLYLYSTKHRVQVIDREIERTVRGTDELREQIRVLHAEWTLQNDPQRLQALADQFLALKTLSPGQFTSLADLDNRLPAVPAPEAAPPEPAEPQPVPVAQAPQPAELPAPPPAPRVMVTTPQPVRPPPAVTVTAPPPPPTPERKPPPPRPVIADVPREHAVTAEVQQPVRPTPASPPRRVVVAEQPRPLQAAAPLTGSALGMARSASAPPPPRPMPVSASQWVGNGGGG